MSIVVGNIDDDLVRIRKTTDGSTIVSVERGTYFAEYQRTQRGLLMISSTYPRSEYDALYNKLNANLKEIDRKSIEMTEAEMRINYIDVVHVDGFTIKVGQSNSLRVFITVEHGVRRALLTMDRSSISFISSAFDKEDNKYVRELVCKYIAKIKAVMEENDMMPSRKQNAPHLYNPDDGELAGMSEVGLQERNRVDKQIRNLFNSMESRGYSNLEIQSMMMESVLETAMQARIGKRSVAR